MVLEGRLDIALAGAGRRREDVGNIDYPTVGALAQLAIVSVAVRFLGLDWRRDAWSNPHKRRHDRLGHCLCYPLAGSHEKSSQ